MLANVYTDPYINLETVESFLCGIDKDLPLGLHLMNLNYDAWAYKWNKVTIAAIKEELCAIYNVPVLKMSY
jgi:hypothetical protein